MKFFNFLRRAKVSGKVSAPANETLEEELRRKLDVSSADTSLSNLVNSFVAYTIFEKGISDAERGRRALAAYVFLTGDASFSRLKEYADGRVFGA